MIYTDYKWWFVRRDDDGYITEVGVRFCQGEYQSITDELSGSVTNQYVRTERLAANNMPDGRLGSDAFESSGKYARQYTQADFGLIKTDEELRAFCDKELSKDTVRKVISAQSV
jgi:hypothetical protein